MRIGRSCPLHVVLSKHLFETLGVQDGLVLEFLAEDADHIVHHVLVSDGVMTMAHYLT